MDFGWNKPAGQAQDDSTPNTANTNASNTSGTSDTASSATPASSWDLPGNNNSNEPVNIEKDSDFSNNKTDDSFSDEFTVDSPSATDKDDAVKVEEDNTDSVITDDAEEETPSATEADNSTEETKTVEEKNSSIIEESIQNTTPSADTKSLADLENDISAQRDKAGKDLADLQEKVSKFDDLLVKIRKMKDEEKSLIQEISSAL